MSVGCGMGYAVMGLWGVGCGMEYGVWGMAPSWGSDGRMQSDCPNLKVVEKTLVALGIAAEFILPAIGTNDLFSQKSRRVPNS